MGIRKWRIIRRKELLLEDQMNGLKQKSQLFIKIQFVRRSWVAIAS